MPVIRTGATGTTADNRGEDSVNTDNIKTQADASQFISEKLNMRVKEPEFHAVVARLEAKESRYELYATGTRRDGISRDRAWRCRGGAEDLLRGQRIPARRGRDRRHPVRPGGAAARQHLDDRDGAPDAGSERRHLRATFEVRRRRGASGRLVAMAERQKRWHRSPGCG